MNLHFRPITRQNLLECVNLPTTPEYALQISPNVLSIAIAYVAPHRIPRAIYRGDRMIGFIMHGREPGNGRYWIHRLMIAAGQTRQGHGKAAMELLLAELRATPDCRAVYVSHMPDNQGAHRLYLGLGFLDTGEVDEDGEVILRFAFPAGDA